MKTFHKGWAIISPEGKICGSACMAYPIYLTRNIAKKENTYPAHGYKGYVVRPVTIITHYRKRKD